MNFNKLNALLTQPVVPLGEITSVPQEETPKLSLQKILSHSFKTGILQHSLPYKAEEAASCVASYSSLDLIRELGLENLTEEEVLSGKTLPPGCSQLENLAPLLTKEQWKTLPRAHFFLCAPHFWDNWMRYSGGSIQPALYMNDQEFSDLYLDRDPDLAAFFALGENVGSHRSLLARLFRTGGAASGEPRIGQNIRELSPQFLDLLVKRTFPQTPWVDERRVSKCFPLEKVEQLSIGALVLLYPSSLAVGHGRAENTPLKEAVKRGFARFSLADIGGDPDLQDLTNPKALSCARSFLPLMSEAQWKGLTQPLFLLFVEASSQWMECGFGMGQTSKELIGIELGVDKETFRQIYESHNIDSSRLFDLIFGKKGGGAVLTERLVPLRPEDARALSHKIDAISASDKENWTLAGKIRPLLWQSTPRFSVADLVAGLGSPTEANALSCDLPPFAKPAVSLLTEAQWRGLPLPAFLFFARATSGLQERECGYGQVSYQPFPVKLTITNATFREIYASHKSSPSVLADLVLGENGPGAIFLERLMPLEFEQEKALLVKLRTLAVSPDNSKIASLITKSFSEDQIRALSKDEFAAVIRFWDYKGRPKMGDPNFTAWLERAVEEKNNSVLSNLSSIEEGQKQNWASLLEQKSPEFLWSLLIAICAQSDQEIKFKRLQFFCELFSTLKWDAMLEKATPDSLISLFENTCLPSKTDADRMKISAALRKLSTFTIPIENQKKILTMFAYTDPYDQIEPLWGTFVKNKIEVSLADFWKDLCVKAKKYWS